MEQLKKIQTKFNKLGCLTEIDGDTLWICENGGIGNFDIGVELDKLPKPKFRWKRYDNCGETQFALTHRRFLNGWW